MNHMPCDASLCDMPCDESLCHLPCSSHHNAPLLTLLTLHTASLLTALLHTHIYRPLFVTFFVVELCHRLSFLVSAHIGWVLLSVLGKRQQCLACTPHLSRHTSTATLNIKWEQQWEGATCAQCHVPLVFCALSQQDDATFPTTAVPAHPALARFC